MQAPGEQKIILAIIAFAVFMATLDTPIDNLHTETPAIRIL
jgi:hypothetical protein